MPQAAMDAEVEAFLDRYRDRRDEQGRRLVVKNGTLSFEGNSHGGRADRS